MRTRLQRFVLVLKTENRIDTLHCLQLLCSICSESDILDPGFLYRRSKDWNACQEVAAVHWWFRSEIAIQWFDCFIPSWQSSRLGTKSKVKFPCNRLWLAILWVNSTTWQSSQVGTIRGNIQYGTLFWHCSTWFEQHGSMQEIKYALPLQSALTHNPVNQFNDLAV